MGKSVKQASRILVTGMSGMLGKSLVPLLLERGYEVVAPDSSELDITKLTAVRELVRGASAEVVINCAAYTAVDKAENDRERAFLVNAEGVSYLASAAKEVGARLVHVSTDFVFDGLANTPYKEEDEPAPLGIYGSSKFEGELNIQRHGGSFIIIRTSWLYGVGSANFVTKIAEKAVTSKELSVVFDQVGTPTSARDLSEAIVNLIRCDENGIFHFSNEGVASWYDFACAVVDGLRRRGVELAVEKIEPVLSSAFRTPAKRPAYSVMDKAKYKNVTGAGVSHWNDALSLYLDSIVKDGRLEL